MAAKKPKLYIRTAGQLGLTQYLPGRTVLKLYKEDLIWAENLGDEAKALEYIAEQDAWHKANCDQMVKEYAEIARDLPEQFRYPTWTWRLATDNDITEIK